MTVLAHNAASGHGAHILAVLGPTLAILLLAVGADLRAWLVKRGHESPATATMVAAALSAGAGVIHAVAFPHHYQEALLYGEFFAGSAVGQLAWAWLVLARPHRWVLVGGLAGNLAIVVLWAVTRTVGIPLGPEAGAVEAVGGLDVTCGVLEVGVVLCCGWLLTPALHKRPRVLTS